MADSPLTGFSHSGYRVVRELGRGALTVTFEAINLHPRLHGRHVALKVLRRAEHSNWFMRVCRATASLCHPSIVTCHEVGESNGWTYMVLEFIEGTDLRDEIRRRTNWSVSDVVHLVRQVAIALDCAHVQGMIHGDLHPRRILLTPDHQPHVIGFGEYPLPPDRPVGNPIHLAPEQLLARPRATRQSDVYALSETAFWMLTGQHPFQTPNHKTPELLAAKGRGPCQSLTELRADLSNAVEQVLQRGMAPKPEERYTSPGEFCEALAASAKMAPADDPQDSVL